MKQTHPQRRVLVVIGSIICQFCVGMLYSWSVFQTPISQMFGWDTGAVSLTFSISTFMLPVAMIVAGLLLPRRGPRWVASLGGIILAIGRIVGETAALMYTSGTVAKVAGLFDSGSTLALHMYKQASEGLYTEQAYATSVILLLLVFIINFISGRIARQITKGR